MPTHTQSKSSDGAASKAKKSCTGGAGRSATGKPLGKAGIRGLDKNAAAVEKYQDICAAAGDGSILADTLRREYLVLARVTRTVGGGRVRVTLLDGTADVSVPIGGSVKMKGHAATKTDRANCMCQDDIVVVRGGQAAGKVSPAVAAEIRAIFDELRIDYPKGFFTATGSAEAADDEFAYEWDRSDQAARETAAVVAARAAAARTSALRAGAAVSVVVAEGVAEAEADVDIDAL